MTTTPRERWEDIAQELITRVAALEQAVEKKKTENQVTLKRLQKQVDGLEHDLNVLWAKVVDDDE